MILDPRANVDFQRQLRNDIDSLTNDISDRFARAERGEISQSECDSGNADDREVIHEFSALLVATGRQLDDWLSTGGALPTQWKDARQP